VLAFSLSSGMKIEQKACIIAGAPMGSDKERVQELALDIAKKSKKFFATIKHHDIPAPVADRLLRLCGVPRLHFLSRVSLFGEYSRAFDYFDNCVEESAAHQADRPKAPMPGDTTESLQSSLPLRHAGLAFRTYSRNLAPTANCAALAAVASHLLDRCQGRLPRLFGIAIRDSANFLRITVPPDLAQDTLPPAGASAEECLSFYASRHFEKLQKKLSRGIEDSQSSHRLIDGTPLTTARINSCEATWASAWLYDPFTEDRMEPEVHAGACKLRLGVPLLPNAPHRCHCGADLTTNPWHVLVHKGHLAAQRRHDRIVDVLMKWVTKVGGLAYEEPREEPGPNSSRRRTDIKIFLGPTAYSVDVGVVHPTAPYSIRYSAREPLGAADAYAKHKIRKYSAQAEREGATFVPFIVETFGGFCKQATELVKAIAKYAHLNSAVWSSAATLTGLRTEIHAELFAGNLQIANYELSRAHSRPSVFGRGRQPRAPRRQRGRLPAQSDLAPSTSGTVDQSGPPSRTPDPQPGPQRPPWATELPSGPGRQPWVANLAASNHPYSRAHWSTATTHQEHPTEQQVDEAFSQHPSGTLPLNLLTSTGNSLLSTTVGSIGHNPTHRQPSGLDRQSTTTQASVPALGNAGTPGGDGPHDRVGL
jgi:hypothetical protein